MTIRSQKMAKEAYPLVNNVKQFELYEKYKNKVDLNNNEHLTKFKKDCEQLEKNYRTQALNLPTMILQAGLCQTVGFLLAKGTDKDKEKSTTKTDEYKNPLPNQYSLILEHLVDLLNEDVKDKSLIDQKDRNEKLLKFHHDKVVPARLPEYQLLTRKALDASSWLKRYAQALLKDPEDQKNSKDSEDNNDQTN